jgi:CHASE1-domain containing sensor protein
MALIYINPLINVVVFLGIAILALTIAYLALFVRRKEIFMGEAEDNARMVERRDLLKHRREGENE